MSVVLEDSSSQIGSLNIKSSSKNCSVVEYFGEGSRVWFDVVSLCGFLTSIVCLPLLSAGRPVEVNQAMH